MITENPHVDLSTCMGTAKCESETATLSEKADHAVEAVGAGIETAGRKLREHTPHMAVLGPAGCAVGEKLEAGGQYLESHGLTGMAEDVTNLIRRNPIPLLLCGIGLGLLLARMVRK